MSFKFNPNIRIAVPHEPGAIVFEFRRPSVEEKNKYTAEKIDIKTEGKERLNDLAAVRIDLYNKLIVKVCGEKDGKQFDVHDANDKPMTTQDFPDEMKLNVVIEAFDGPSAIAKNF